MLGTGAGDVLRAQGSALLLNGDADADLLTVEVESLHADGRAGADRLLGAQATIPLSLQGGSGADTLEGGAADDTLAGGPGDDTERGNGGTDRFDQGAAADGSDDLDGGGSPYDLIDYSQRAAAVRIDLDGADDDGEAGERDALADTFEYLEGGAGDDTIVASQARYQPFDVKGHGGADLVIAGTNTDSIDGGPGDDDLRGGASSDSFTGGPGDDRMLGGDSSDIFREGDEPGPTGADDMQGGAGVDTYFASGRLDPLAVKLDGLANDGGAGEGDNVRTDVESIVTGRADDVIAGSAVSSVDAGPGDDDVSSGDGADVVYGYAGDDKLDGGAGDDDVRGGQGADRLCGRRGGGHRLRRRRRRRLRRACRGGRRRPLAGGPGRDRASYSARSTAVSVTLDDVADDGAAGEGDLVGAEAVTGGRAADRLVGSEGDDVLDGGAGDDDLDGARRAPTGCNAAGTAAGRRHCAAAPAPRLDGDEDTDRLYAAATRRADR